MRISYWSSDVCSSDLFKVVKLAGDFVWHAHSDTDETFIVLEGELCIDVRGGFGGDGAIVLRTGQMAVVPKGVEHRPCANGEVRQIGRASCRERGCKSV